MEHSCPVTRFLKLLRMINRQLNPCLAILVFTLIAAGTTYYLVRECEKIADITTSRTAAEQQDSR